MIPEYLDTNCIVYQRDGVDFINRLHAESVQLIWTDPPGTSDSSTSHKNFSQMEAVELCAAVADAAYRVLTPSGVLAICLSHTATEGVVPAVVKRTHMQDGGFVICSADWESTIVIFHKGAPKSNSMREYDGPDDRLSMITPFIEEYTDEGDIVADPFCGSGYVLEAAVKANRIAFVNDQDPDAVAATIARYKEHCAR